MNKLKEELLKDLTPDNCCKNELVVLPQSGDVGFEEYFHHKTRAIMKAKKLFSPQEQNGLMLSYPKPDSKEPYVFERFFESPSVVACNHAFEGCFAIDISAYIGKTNEETFEKLIAYMHSNNHTVFLLFLYSDNKNEVRQMHGQLSRYDEIKLVDIPLPDAKMLTDYTMSGIRDFSLHIKSDVEKYLEKYYEKKNLGYDYADFLVRYLKNNGYAGEIEPMKEATNKVDLIWNKSAMYLGLGY